MKKLKDFIDIIFKEEHTGEEWRKIDSEVDVVYKTATDEEKKEFEVSGAADMLGMLVEYVD